VGVGVGVLGGKGKGGDLWHSFVLAYICIFLCVCGILHTCNSIHSPLHVRAHARAHTHTYTRTHAHKHTHIHTYTRMLALKHAQIHAHAHAHTYSYTGQLRALGLNSGGC